MTNRDTYWANVAKEMGRKRANATTLLHSSPKLQRIIWMIYQEKSPVSLTDLVKEPRLKDQHRLSEEQLTYRLVELLQADLLIEVSKTRHVFAIPMWASSFIAARTKAIRAGEL